MITPNTDKAHQRYFLKGKRVPGGSTIAKQCQDCQNLMDWVQEMMGEGRDPAKVGQREARIGEIAHALFQSYVTGDNIDLQHCAATEIVKARQSADKAIGLWMRLGLSFVSAEEQLVSPKGYGGTLDVVGQLPDETFVLLDWKRSNNVYLSHLIQVGGYEPLWNENHPDQKISQRWVIRLGKEGFTDFDERKIEDWEMEILTDLFMNQMENYKLHKKWDKAHEKKS